MLLAHLGKAVVDKMATQIKGDTERFARLVKEAKVSIEQSTTEKPPAGQGRAPGPVPETGILGKIPPEAHKTGLPAYVCLFLGVLA